MMSDFEQDAFSLKHARLWLSVVAIACAFIVWRFPPAWWLTVLGGVLLIAGTVAFAARTDQWMTWENEGSLNDFEGYVATTGCLMVLVPLVALLLRVIFSAPPE
jgi:hypothetical protein